ncbi:DUF3037 domain-containing protein [Listeria booriae]|uniref:DUF3037 domain-containing protein n=1 Tax=Listeria booriae TaxID=1552123 RepID=UPI0028800FFA|nr:DUF3037 domain-containing protein [Listeria booriae]MDT0109218.1 DUF3037 domain-containing protein [Listeria booriae]
MEGTRTAGAYSIIRYMPDEYLGEVINIGIILHNEDGTLHYEFLKEDNPKIRSFLGTKHLLNNYKFSVQILGYYLENLTGFDGEVADFSIASPCYSDFLSNMKNYFAGKALIFTEPKLFRTSNPKKFFDSLFAKYVGVFEGSKVRENAKTIVRSIFEQHDFLDKKVAYDHQIKPIKALKDITVKIDFIYKNGVLNYLQAVPEIESPGKKMEWVAKTKMLFDSVDFTKVKIKFLYDKHNEEIDEIISYFEHFNKNVKTLNISDDDEVENLIAEIEKNAHDNVLELIS